MDYRGPTEFRMTLLLGKFRLRLAALFYFMRRIGLAGLFASRLFAEYVATRHTLDCVYGKAWVSRQLPGFNVRSLLESASMLFSTAISANFEAQINLKLQPWRSIRYSLRSIAHRKYCVVAAVGQRYRAAATHRLESITGHSTEIAPLPTSWNSDGLASMLLEWVDGPTGCDFRMSDLVFAALSIRWSRLDAEEAALNDLNKTRINNERESMAKIAEIAEQTLRACFFEQRLKTLAVPMAIARSANGCIPHQTQPQASSRTEI